MTVTTNGQASSASSSSSHHHYPNHTTSSHPADHSQRPQPATQSASSAFASSSRHTLDQDSSLGASHHSSKQLRSEPSPHLLLHAADVARRAHFLPHQHRLRQLTRTTLTRSRSRGTSCRAHRQNCISAHQVAAVLLSIIPTPRPWPLSLSTLLLPSISLTRCYKHALPIVRCTNPPPRSTSISILLRPHLSHLHHIPSRR